MNTTELKTTLKTTTVVFKDCGQDFLEWDIEDGKIGACRPFQGSVWVGRKVLSKSLKVGGSITISPSAGKDPLTIRYPITGIYRNIYHPLFIPLKAKYYDAFERREKDTEYRPRNQTWNATTCWIGRTVILSKGYGKLHRMHAEIVGFSYDAAPTKRPGWRECYGDKAGEACCIKLKIITD